ncbi:hypothetical protein TSUD_137860 [Trifolium subterraneum]|uniref:Uncharacterized protein n=1 Tax=Trifolium subterraneum TaxID=3900 RepID=A0A2Z6NUA4_TRISU|nr:hypothetical protein TSUD_137860 [Trifolium subterraneum]
MEKTENIGDRRSTPSPKKSGMCTFGTWDRAQARRAALDQCPPVKPVKVVVLKPKVGNSSPVAREDLPCVTIGGSSSTKRRSLPGIKIGSSPSSKKEDRTLEDGNLASIRKLWLLIQLFVRREVRAKGDLGGSLHLNLVFFVQLTTLELILLFFFIRLYPLGIFLVISQIYHTTKAVAMEGLPHPHVALAISTDTSHSRKGLWTYDEDKTLVESLKQHGPKSWSQIPNPMKRKLEKQCRERWFNHLCPNIMKDPWTVEEDMMLIKSHKVFGNKSKQIAKTLLGRSENSIKNHWNATRRCQRISRMKNKNPEITNDGSLLHAYIKEVTNSEEVENELRKKTSEMSLDDSLSSKGLIGNGEGTTAANVINGENIKCGAIVEELNMDMDFMEIISEK